MSVRVLSTDQAKTSIARMQAIIASGLAGELSGLQAEGRMLSDPSVWDGVEATRFRSDTWPSVSRALVQCVDALEALQQHISRVNQNIMTAGGNG
jgi:uncharacterized protein YukE